jgi:hypothetical protein
VHVYCRNFAFRILALLLSQAACSPLLHAENLKPEDLVVRHLNSIGAAEARAASKSRVIQGTSEFVSLVGGSGRVQGTSGFVSEQRKVDILMKLGNSDYRGEQFISDGDKVYVAATISNHRRSSFGEFVHSQDQIVREGLLGGVLSTAWALQNLDHNQPKLSYEGLKRMDGRQLHYLRYRCKKNDDMNIHLYFDPETYRHVMTVYSLTAAAGFGTSVPSATDQLGMTSPSNMPGGDPTQSSKQKEVRYTIEERFSDFKTTDGLTLPEHYTIHFTEELQNGHTTVFEWEITANEVSTNMSLDPRNFLVK